ncbi:60S Ribosomal protein [Parasponia andersonii]|uniref:60S Ribosomal protein n=1 Tax=Parasponia andersonii TaxID=3476 RepID=A0A2P5B5U6_PARAD|nr:60S Ribosomal protein [Parasponia andersonii]
MAQQEEGWPLGLQPLNARVGFARTRDFSGSISFNTLLTGSPTCSTDSSSDLDTESTGSFFHDKSITLGSLIGVSSILELSRSSIRGRKSEPSKEKKTNNKSRTKRIWCFSLCRSDITDIAENPNSIAPSLGHFLAVERKAANECRRDYQSHGFYAPDELALAQPTTEPNSLFVNGLVAPPQSSTDMDMRRNRGLDHGIGRGISLLCPCLSGQSSR